MTEALRTVSLIRLEGQRRQKRQDHVAHEEPLEIQVNGASVAVVMRTPGDDEDLVRGFLLTERIVASLKDVESLRHCTTVPDPDAEDNVMQVRLKEGVPFDLERLRRHLFASSSCGVCGKATIENACATAAPVTSSMKVSARWLSSLPERLAHTQHAHARSGGLHAAGLWHVDGPIVVAREDVGRHNAFDKMVGACSRMFPHPPGGETHHIIHRPKADESSDPSRAVVLVSGRVSFELVQKAVAARLPVLAGISAPTSLAVRMAEALGVTVVGFVRGDTMNIYSHAERVV